MHPRQRLAAFCAILAAGFGGAGAQEFVPPLANPTTPNIAGVALGVVPDYLGSDDPFFGAVPLLRYQRPRREQSVTVFGNVLKSNVLNHPVLRTGPTGVWRFGRSDVSDPVVGDLPEINDSLDLGWQVGAEFIDPDDIARRIRFDLNLRQDVTGVHNGYVAGAAVSGWVPTRFFLLGLYGSASWGSADYTSTYFGVEAEGAAASGLEAFDAGAGPRDVSAAAVGIVPVGDHLIAGAGVFYSRLLGDAADSPVVADRGSANQWIAGAGVAYTW